MQRLAFDFFDPIDENEYGVDEDGRVPHVDDSAHRVTIPQGRLNLSVEHLSANFNPLTERNNHAYQEVVLHLFSFWRTHNICFIVLLTNIASASLVMYFRDPLQ